MKRIILFVLLMMSLIIFVACKKKNIVENFVPPAISSKVEILEINGHEVTLKVISSTTDYCKAGDVIKGELKGFDYQYNKYHFKVGDIMNVWSDFDSVTETEVKFDSLAPVGHTYE